MIFQKKIDGSWTTCAEYMGTVGDQTLNGNLSISNGNNLNLGEVNQEKYCSVNLKRKMFGENYEAQFGIGGLSNKGHAQVQINKIENGVSKYQNRFLFRGDCFYPEVGASIGNTSHPFNNGYFRSSVFMGNYSAINANSTNEYAVLNFTNNENNSKYGYVGKGSANSTDLQVRSLISDLELSTPTQNAVKIGTATNYVYTHFGAKSWRFAPSESINGVVSLGSTTERFKVLYATTTPNISSDKSLKENIRYIDDINTLSTKETITKENCYNFIKNELHLAEYNMKNDENKNLHLGFIAQDLEGKTVGDKIVSKDENGLLSYNTGNYTSVLTLALQKAMDKIEKLELEIKSLKNN